MTSPAPARDATAQAAARAAEQAARDVARIMMRAVRLRRVVGVAAKAHAELSGRPQSPQPR
jgi:hypothetical protein